jgi:hypothetical protein
MSLAAALWAGLISSFGPVLKVFDDDKLDNAIREYDEGNASGTL